MRTTKHRTRRIPRYNNKKGKPKMKKYLEIAVVAIVAVIAAKRIPVIKDMI